MASRQTRDFESFITTPKGLEKLDMDARIQAQENEFKCRSSEVLPLSWVRRSSKTTLSKDYTQYNTKTSHIRTRHHRASIRTRRLIRGLSQFPNTEIMGHT
ncbi:hypothetical protein E2C01_021070 [Portunus trituberculatus]|uniref:Uncharacterized protein n=1 Tax=Portunus trituberculatus TaxID=210409 RepID=A0A5B7E1I9_PORTR|nr:hypothetical protein [Portunus trituberculatus]